MMKSKLIVFFIVGILLHGGFLFGQEEDCFSESFETYPSYQKKTKGKAKKSKSESEKSFKIIAQYQEKMDKRILAIGNVEIHYNDIKLFADRIDLNTETKDVYAADNVVLHLPDEVLSASEIRFNLDSTQGEIKNAFGRVQPTISYEADTVERRDENTYIFRKARITSCTQSIPRWRFSCSKATFKKDDYMEMWGSVFKIRNIPVFYFPYMRYPLNRQRATGFLMPQLGYSGTKGQFFSESFYWVIKRNMDATFSFDYYSARGMGGGLEYRYMLSKRTQGHLNAYFFNFKKDPELEENPENAYLLRFNHNQILPFNFNLVANIDFQSSFEFLREFDNNFRRAVQTKRSSQVYLSRAWSYFNLNIEAGRFETYFTKRDDSIIKHNLPRLKFSASKIKLFLPFYFSFSSSFRRWEYGWESDYERDRQKRSQNLFFKPVLTFPFKTIPWLTVNSSFSANFNYYFQSYAPNKNIVTDEHLFTHNYEIRAKLTGPVFYRIFYGSDNEPKIKHLIEPTFSYRYESPIDSSDRIISALGVFRFHQITYGLTNRFFMKQDKRNKEVIRFSLSQTFYLVPEESPLKRYLVDGEVPKFADIRGSLRVYPSRKYRLDFSTSFNPYYNTFSRLTLRGSMGAPQDPYFLRISWYKSINSFLQDDLYNRHQINCFVGFKIPRLSLETMAEVDFNIEEKKMLYTALSMIYTYQCLDFKADVRIFYFRDKPEVQYRISFGLGNIGKSTDFLGGMGF